jgi:hypothetical protein
MASRKRVEMSVAFRIDPVVRRTQQIDEEAHA